MDFEDNSSTESDEGEQVVPQLEELSSEEEPSSAFSESSDYTRCDPDDQIYETDSEAKATPAPKNFRKIRKCHSRLFKYSPQAYCECRKNNQSGQQKKKREEIENPYERCDTCQEYVQPLFKHCRVECFEERGKPKEHQLAAFLDLAYAKRNLQIRYYRILQI